MKLLASIASLLFMFLSGTNSLDNNNGGVTNSIEQQLQELNIRLDLMYVESSEKMENLSNELHSLKQSLDSLTWVAERVEQSVQSAQSNNDLILRNVTTLTLNSNEIMMNQQYCANHEALKNQFFELIPKCSGGGHLPVTPPNTTAAPPTSTPSTDETIYRSCQLAPGQSGVYKLALNISDPFEAFCEQEKFGGHWMVIQSRQDGSVDFNRSWSEYKEGFGDASGEYWIGLEKLYRLTSLDKYELLIVMENFTNFEVFEKYRGFQVRGVAANYQLVLGDAGTGTAGNSLYVYRNERFQTYDNQINSCSTWLASGFWHYSCGTYGDGKNNINGVYGNRPSDPQGVWWGSFNNGSYNFSPLKRVKMMMRILE